MRLRKQSGMTVLLCILATMLFPANAFAYAAQADGNVDPALVEQANDLLDLLPEYIIDALEDEDVPIYITDKDIDDYFFNGQAGATWGVYNTYYDGTADIYVEDTERAVYESVIHEVGHWLDDYCGKITSTEEYSAIYDAEYPVYYDVYDLTMDLEQPKEFFAEGFRKYYTDREIFQENCPQLYSLIQSTLAALEEEG